jgi:pSer/pThr/pTyr-binding forkhead associated (FHA) protein
VLCCDQLLIKFGATTRTVALVPGVNRIGRNPAGEICIEDATVSGDHCEIVVQNDGVLVRDLGSTNGTFLDGHPVEGAAALFPGQTLRIGAVEAVLQPPAQISIPELSFRVETHPILADGLAACINHPTAHGTLECVQCQKVFCELCVHQVRRLGGKALTLCPSCSGHCRPIVRAGPEKKKRSKIVAWISKLTAKMTGRIVRTKDS